MQNFHWTKLTLGVLVIMSIVLAACAQAVTPGAPAQQPAGNMPQAAKPAKLIIAVLPILDALPMYVAQQEGLFQQEGVAVEFIPVASAAERDQLIASGQADGMINEVVSAIFYNKDKPRVKIVRFARTATPESPLFHLLASAKSGITGVEGLKGVEIGVSQGTVIDYLTHRLLQAEGFKPDEIKTIAVPKIPDRMALLGSGELKAAMLPDPTSWVAISQGAKVIIDDTKHPEYSYSTYTFRNPVIEQNPAAIRAFLSAIEKATAKINADPNRWNTLLTDRKLVPAPLVGKYQVPQFVTAGVPSQAQWDDTLAWVKEEGLVDKDVSYQDSVTPAYLPK